MGSSDSVMKSVATMTPDEYEKAVCERLRIVFPPPGFVVRQSVSVPGNKTKIARKIDVGVFEAGKDVPIVIADAKRHARSIEATKAGSMIALVQDVGRIRAVMVSTSRFSLAARNHLVSEGVEYLTLTLQEAFELNWIPKLEAEFAVDREFKEISGGMVEALRNADPKPFLNSPLPFEEWLAVFSVGQSSFPESTLEVLKIMARDHYDDGVRFNAILLIDKAGRLDRKLIEALYEHERDAETLEYLQELLARGYMPRCELP